MRVVAKVRLILNGKPLCGKSSLAQRLAENYNLEVIEIDELVKECMALAGRAELGRSRGGRGRLSKAEEGRDGRPEGGRGRGALPELSCDAEH